MVNLPVIALLFLFLSQFTEGAISSKIQPLIIDEECIECLRQFYLISDNMKEALLSSQYNSMDEVIYFIKVNQKNTYLRNLRSSYGCGKKHNNQKKQGFVPNNALEEQLNESIKGAMSECSDIIEPKFEKNINDRNEWRRLICQAKTIQDDTCFGEEMNNSLKDYLSYMCKFKINNV